MRQSSSIKHMICLGVVGVLVAACASPQQSVEKKKKRSKEYFAESVYGVKASPRVAEGKQIRRGGGRDQIGKPYKVKNKWYKPKEDPNYAKTGRASWYGSAFHGRLTANGEVYDMTHLTAAHPTMPLPSYARVTNTVNGSSVIVRVNDRGPYANDRIIDLSEKAAEMLDYKHHGTASVKVEYVGRAPLDGQDDEYLLASYRNGSDPVGQPATGVMLAMAAPIPASVPVPAFAGNALAAQQPAQDLPFGFVDNGAEMPVLPAVVPVPLQKPANLYNVASAKISSDQQSSLILAYADQRVAQANSVYANVLLPEALSDTWRDAQHSLAQQKNQLEQGEYVDLGTFTDSAQADRITAALKAFGSVSRSVTPQSGSNLYSMVAKAKSPRDNDKLLQAAWAAGAEDAFVVRAD